MHARFSQHFLQQILLVEILQPEKLRLKQKTELLMKDVRLRKKQQSRKLLHEELNKKLKPGEEMQLMK